MQRNPLQSNKEQLPPSAIARRDSHEVVVLKRTFFAASLFLAFCLHAAPAAAYIGPGLGTGTIAAVLGILAGILMLVVGALWYPLKRLVRKMRSKEQ